MNERGSVTIYALIVLLPIMLFLGLIFELTRIHSAEVQAEQKTKAAARSVLSLYDRDLRADYGLFGLAADESMLKAVAADTATGFQGEPSWNTSTPILADVQVSAIYTLADHRFFRRQILEEMKLKAPIEFTRHVYDKWKEYDADIQDAAKAMALSEEMERLLRKREDRLREAFSALTRMKRLMEQGKAILQQPVPPKPDPEDDEEEEAAWINPYNATAPIFSSLNQELSELHARLRDAEAAESEIQYQMAKEEASHDLLAGITLYGQEFYTRYHLDAANSVALFGTTGRLAMADPYAEKDFTFASMFVALYNDKQAEEHQRRTKHDEQEEKKREAGEKTESQLKETKEWIEQQVCKPEDEAHYEKLQSAYEQYLAYNARAGEADSRSNPTAALDQSSKDWQRGSLFQLRSMSDMLQTIRDEVYINEYVLLYFNHRLTDDKSAPIMGNVTEHRLKGQEAEYVLYGLSSCSANRAAAYAELYAVRFAVRTIEALVDTRKAILGSPMLILLTAAAEGAAKAHMDMQKLLDGEEIPIFHKQPQLKMSYVDYLRVFMAAHSNESRKMARIQSLIAFNSEIDLTERPVYVQAKTQYRLPLWFFPAAAKLVLQSDVQEGGATSHWIDKKAEMAY